MPNQNKKIRSCRRTLYRIRNWSAYEKALVQRGSITFWLSDDFEKTWRHAGDKQRGAQFVYSDQAISVMLTVKEVFHLTNREAEGFLQALFKRLNVSLPVPDHPTLSKRGKILKVKLPKKAHEQSSIVMDSTGMKIYGEGEWKVRTYGKSKRRTWRKLHLGADPDSGEIQAAVLAKNSVSDDEWLNRYCDRLRLRLSDWLLMGVTINVGRTLVSTIIRPMPKVLIPPRQNARIWQHGNTHAEHLKRDENLRYIRKHGLSAWKQASGYHVRSLAETTMFQMKTILGDNLSARLLATQTTQALIRCATLNQMTHLGMPQSYRVD
jgi:hypothetical protein